MKPPLSARTVVAGIVGAPVRHSLSPLLHNAWLGAAGIDGVYVAFPCREGAFTAFVEGMRGGAVRGLNVTIPFKETALAAGDLRSPLARAGGAANLLLFDGEGRIEARNTDGEGLLFAFRSQAPDFVPSAAPIVLFGAGGAARGAAAALLDAGTPELRIVNRTFDRAQALADLFGPRVKAIGWADGPAALEGAGALVNATALGLAGAAPLEVSLDRLPPNAVVMDMVYRPLATDFLKRARQAGFRTVDGLDMLIGQAMPSFEAFFGEPPPDIDVRTLALEAMGS